MIEKYSDGISRLDIDSGNLLHSYQLSILIILSNNIFPVEIIPSGLLNLLQQLPFICLVRVFTAINIIKQ